MNHFFIQLYKLIIQSTIKINRIKVEKEYKGIFNNRMIAHSQGTIIYASKLRDGLETEEGRWNFNS